MARYIREIQLDRPDDFVQYIMNDFLQKHGFQLVQFKGEQVFRAGGGFIEIPKFLVWSYQNGRFHIEAWTRDMWLPGVYGKEKDMTGFTGHVPKSAYKKDIDELTGVLCQPLPENGQPVMGANGQPDGGQVVYVRGTDMSRHATMGLVLSLVGLVIGLLLNVLLGIVFGMMGIVYGNRGRASGKKGMGIAAMVIGIVTIVICVLALVANIGVGLLSL